MQFPVLIWKNSVGIPTEFFIYNSNVEFIDK